MLRYSKPLFVDQSSEEEQYGSVIEAFNYNVAIIGDKNVGKTLFVDALTRKPEADPPEAKNCVISREHSLLVDKYRTKLRIQEYPGGEDGWNMIKDTLNDFDGVIVMFDYSNSDSITFALDKVLLCKRSDMIVVLVGNKTDLDKERASQLTE